MVQQDAVADKRRLRVSIIVPTHFRQALLSRLLRALGELDYPHDLLELIVVGAEADPSRAIVESFGLSAPFPVKYHIVGRDTLRSVAFKRNAGAEAAAGDILAFLDDDCVPHREWIKEALVYFREPQVGGVEGRIEIPQPDLPTRTYRGSLRLKEPGGYRTGNIFYRRSAFRECGGFDESLPYLEDTDFGFTLIERGYLIPFSLAAVVDHPVQPARPLTPVRLARTARDLPYIFSKHSASGDRLRDNLRLFNRAHFPYLALYVMAAMIAVLSPLKGARVLVLGLLVLVPLHLVYEYRGLSFTWKEILLSAVSQPLVPVLRLAWWLLGSAEVALGLRRTNHMASR